MARFQTCRGWALRPKVGWIGVTNPQFKVSVVDGRERKIGSMDSDLVTRVGIFNNLKPISRFTESFDPPQPDDLESGIDCLKEENMVTMTTSEINAIVPYLGTWYAILNLGIGIL
mmetsp:Transcript_2082/g.4701  ORF Transcript_2082/g.4701 Transcript_2082/m.4701 type:complete len:115 (-) Transcript_2082:780-1124(-)